MEGGTEAEQPPQQGSLPVTFKTSAERTYHGADVSGLGEGQVENQQRVGQLASAEHQEAPLLAAASRRTPSRAGQPARASPTSCGGALSGFRQPSSLSTALVSKPHGLQGQRNRFDRSPEFRQPTFHMPGSCF